MNRPPYRSVFAVLALTLLAAARLPAAGQPDDANAPAATPAPASGASVTGPLAAEDKKKATEKEKDRDDAGDADGEKDADKADDDAKGGVGEDEAAGPAIDRLRAFYKETIGEFRRTDFRQYDRAGDDASVGYSVFEKGEGRVPWVVFTAYFYPARGDSLDDDVEAAIADVTSQHEEAEVGKPEVVEVSRHGKKVKGRRVRFKFTHVFGGREQALASELYLFPGATGRLVKYRISFPAADAKTLQKKVDAFAKEFPWPPGL
jgi:hypothetical protein